MAHALLINPSYFRTYGSAEGGIAFPVFPILGLASLGGAIKARGHTFRILDLSYRRYEPDLLRAAIRAERPDVVGITATTPLINQARDISFLVKELDPTIITIAGGAHPSALPRETLQESALDLVAAGETDWVIADLLDGRAPADIPGVWQRDGRDMVAPVPAGLISDLDTLPLPAWEDYPPDTLRVASKLMARNLPVTGIEFSRGCIYSCDFCASKNTLGRGYRKKSPERCADELERLVRLGFREATLHDDIFTTDANWAASVCEEIIRRGIDLPWSCSNGIRVDAVSEELFALMKRAGCYRVYFGLETGNEEVLRAFGKGGQATLDRGVEAVAMAHRAGLEPNGFFMMGLLGDTEESMQDTIDYARRMKLDTMKCGMCVPYPGTPMFQQLQAEGRIKTFDWDAYTVYNRVDAIYDHPSLSWDTIADYFQRFYRDVYLRSPSYLWRRFRFLVRNRELISNLWYLTKFWGLLRRGRPDVEPECYQYEDQWRPLSKAPEDVLPVYPITIARRRGTALGRSSTAVDT